MAEGDPPVATLLPHRGNVVLELDIVEGAWAVIHRKSLERVSLPRPAEGWWVLEFDEERFGFVSDGQEVLYLEDVFADPVYEVNGRPVVLQGAGGTGEIGMRPIDLGERGHRHSLCEVRVWLETRRQWATFEGAMFDVRRPLGNRLFWNLTSMVSELKLHMNGRACDWVHKRWPRMFKFLQEVVRIDPPLLRSTPWSQSAPPPQDDDLRSLRFPSVGFTGLLALLAKWSFLPRAAGALQDEGDKVQTRQLLTAFLNGCRSMDGVAICCVGDVKFDWPAAP